MQTITYRMDKQGPTVQHRALYSISCNKPGWKRIENIEIDLITYTNVGCNEGGLSNQRKVGFFIGGPGIIE